MPRQTRVTRKWGDIPFVAGATKVLDLPLGLDLESIQLYIAGSLTVTAGYTGINSEGLSKLVRRLDLMANGETVASISGELLVHGNPARKIVKTNPAFAAGATSGEAVGFLDFAHIGGVRPKDSVLRTAGFRQLQLRVTWGQWSDVFVGAGGVSANDVSMKVALRETADHDATPAPEVRRLSRMIEKTYAASTVERIALDPELLYRKLVLRSEDGGELAGDVINSVQIQIGNDHPIDLEIAQLQDMNAQDYPNVTFPDGIYVVDFAPSPFGQSKIADFLDTSGRNGDAFLILDVNGGAGHKVQILSDQFQAHHEAIQANRVRRG